MTLITSRRNQYFKTARSLISVNQRRKQKKFLAEGDKFIYEAFKAGVEIDFVLYTTKAESNENAVRIIKEAEGRNIPVYKIKEDLFEELTETETPQGILACVHFPEVEDYKASSGKESFFLMVDAIQDPGNLGTLIRLADAAGVDRIFINKGTVDQYNAKVLRSTMGSIFHIPIQRVEYPVDIIKSFQEHGIQVFATSPHKGQIYFECDFTTPILFVIGAEGRGISEEILSIVNKYITIPIVGKAESLNAAMASGILLYEVVRQRSGLFKKI